MSTKYIKWFESISSKDIELVGGKNANLGEMYTNLKGKGVDVPNGFAITSNAYKYILKESNAVEKLHSILDPLNSGDLKDLAKRAELAREVVYKCKFPSDVTDEILNSWNRLRQEYGPDVTVAVRSSATAEDLPTASFAGQQDSFLNIATEDELLEACKRCFASLFTDRSIHYRIDQNFDHFKVALSIGVMKMVRSDLASSGVAFTLDTDSGYRDVVFITANYGLGETVVQGTVDPDEYYVHKPTFDQGYRAVLRKVVGTKKIKMVYGKARISNPTRTIPTSRAERIAFCLTDADILTLAEYSIAIEKHYAGIPMDIEWAKDGIDNKIYIVQARPETVISQRKVTSVLEHYSLDTKEEAVEEPLLKGHAIGSKISSGIVRVVLQLHELNEFKAGEILVADSTSPDWEPIMKIAGGIITNRGGRTCHSAIVSRELGLAAIIGTERGTEVLKTGDIVTLDCSPGDMGFVHAGAIPFTKHTTDVERLGKPQTRIMVNLANPASAFKASALPVDGVGLARMEFIISQDIKAHPMALAHPERLDSTLASAKRYILAISTGFDDPKEFFITKLAEGVGTIAAAFYPRPVIVRMSDFKSNEYATLVGGSVFEEPEENPMIGFRGASRYTHPNYADGFELECAAMKRVRDTMGLKNVILMVPFCRTVQEAERVLHCMESFGLSTNGPSSVKIYMMCEIPNNVLMIDQFLDVFDGISIGSNDLTQLCLGVDRDSAILAYQGLFDENSPGVKKLVGLAIDAATARNKYCGLCGQAPSDNPEYAKFLVSKGIESISVNPDMQTVVRTITAVLEAEAELKGRRF